HPNPANASVLQQAEKPLAEAHVTIHAAPIPGWYEIIAHLRPCYQLEGKVLVLRTWIPERRGAAASSATGAATGNPGSGKDVPKFWGPGIRDSSRLPGGLTSPQDEIVQTIYSRDCLSRVHILRRANGTYGYEGERYDSGDEDGFGEGWVVNERPL